MRSKGKWDSSRVLLLAGIIVVSFNLRPGITSIGPVIGLIGESLQLSHTQLGILTTLPLIAFSTTSLFVFRLTSRIGFEKSIMVGIVIIGISTMIRGLGSPSLLFGGTALMGLGIAICNVALIPLIKERMSSQVAFATGAYTLSMSIFSALGSGITAPIAVDTDLGWEGALMVWAVPALLTIPLWSKQIIKKREVESDENDQFSINVWRSRRAWQITIFMGLQSFFFFSMAAWGPEILLSKGFSMEAGGWALFYVQIISLPAVFFVPVLADKEGWLQRVAAVMIIFFLAAFIFFLSHHSLYIFMALTFLGLGMGGSISLAYYLINQSTIYSVNTVRLSGMAQSFGYYIAAAGPFLIGWSFDQFGDWNIILSGFLGIVVFYGYFIFAAIRKGKMETDGRISRPI